MTSAAVTEEVDLALLTRSFERHFGEPVAIETISKFPRGVSRETWFLRCAVGGREAEEFVFRRDLASGAICLGELRDEFEIYHRLRGTGVPIAEALWFEDDPELLDGERPFYVRRSVAGNWEIPGLLDPAPEHAAMRREIGREHVRALARVHGVDWRAQGLDTVLAVPDGPGDVVRTLLRLLSDDIARLQLAPLPVLRDALDWFEDNQPAFDGPICLVKGTNGYGEEVFSDGRIVAMSDWEIACLGDPAMDFALAQNMFDDASDMDGLIWSLDHALAYYEELTGRRVSLEAIEFYRKFYGLYRIQYAQSAASQLARGDGLCRLAWVALEVKHLGQRALAGAIGYGGGALPEMGQRS